MSGTLRIARKYELEELSSYLVKQVVDDWPVTLEDYDRLEVVYLENRRRWQSGRRDAKRYADLFPEPLAAIAFAREFDCPQILPAAYYHLTKVAFTDDWGAEESTHLRARWFLADEVDLRRVLHGRSKLEALAYSTLKNAAWPLMTGNSSLASTPCCMKTLRRLLAVIWGTSRTGHDQLSLLKRCVDYKSHLHFDLEYIPAQEDVPQLCAVCNAALQVWVKKERSKLWDSLPDYFQLK